MWVLYTKIQRQELLSFFLVIHVRDLKKAKQLK